MTKTIAISDELHQKLKVEAAKAGIDLKDFVAERLS
jgi:predicted HicB family RNase H-like nuclease